MVEPVTEKRCKGVADGFRSKSSRPTAGCISAAVAAGNAIVRRRRLAWAEPRTRERRTSGLRESIRVPSVSAFSVAGRSRVARIRLSVPSSAGGLGNASSAANAGRQEEEVARLVTARYEPRRSCHSTTRM
jgi:hypothetical protein